MQQKYNHIDNFITIYGEKEVVIYYTAKIKWLIFENIKNVKYNITCKLFHPIYLQIKKKLKDNRYICVFI
jgi:hypothetical protein